MFLNEKKARVYSPNSVPQIIRLLLKDVIILSKTDPRIGSKKEKRSYGKVNSLSLKNKVIFYDAFAV